MFCIAVFVLTLQLVNNVGCVFMKFVNEGKCTIRLREPPVDICVSKVIICFSSFSVYFFSCLDDVGMATGRASGV